MIQRVVANHVSAVLPTPSLTWHRLGEAEPFSVETEKRKTFGHLKTLIKQKNLIVFADISANVLDLYHVDIPDDKDLIINIKAHPLGFKLRITRKLVKMREANSLTI